MNRSPVRKSKTFSLSRIISYIPTVYLYVLMLPSVPSTLKSNSVSVKWHQWRMFLLAKAVNDLHSIVPSLHDRRKSKFCFCQVHIDEQTVKISLQDFWVVVRSLLSPLSTLTCHQLDFLCDDIKLFIRCRSVSLYLGFEREAPRHANKHSSKRFLKDMYRHHNAASDDSAHLLVGQVASWLGKLSANSCLIRDLPVVLSNASTALQDSLIA